MMGKMVPETSIWSPHHHDHEWVVTSGMSFRLTLGPVTSNDSQANIPCHFPMHPRTRSSPQDRLKETLFQVEKLTERKSL